MVIDGRLQVLDVADGNTDVDAIRKAVEQAKAVTDKPSIIVTHTLIGYGSPNKVNSYAAHGAPLGADETDLTRKELKWEYGEFEVLSSSLQEDYADACFRPSYLHICTLHLSLRSCRCVLASLAQVFTVLCESCPGSTARVSCS
jgi:hypothetical protein